MNKTLIGWVKNPDGTQGYTWNPITGCLNGCEYCYARKLANSRLKTMYLANKNVAPYKDERDYMNNRHNPFYPRFWEDRVKQMALYTSTGKGIFTCDMSDLFGIGIPTEWTRAVLFAINLNRRNRFYLLTKQPQNLIKWSPFPDNCWVGVSATDNEMAYNASCNLMSVKASVKYTSFEPLLGRISPAVLDVLTDKRGINWVIIGSQTKPYKTPKIEWVTEIIRTCDKAGIPVFLKNNLNSENLPTNAFNKEGFVRQEMPDSIPLGVGVKNDTG